MRARIIAVALLFALQAPFALSAELAKITSWDYGTSDVPELITVIFADADGNLRIEGFGVNSEATSSGGKIEMKYTPGSLRDVMIFQAEERRMLVYDRGQCRVMDTQTPGGPGMPAIPPDAMAQMQEAIAQMEKDNPELAKMMKQQASASNMLGAMVQKPRETIVAETKTFSGLPAFASLSWTASSSIRWPSLR